MLETPQVRTAVSYHRTVNAVHMPFILLHKLIKLAAARKQSVMMMIVISILALGSREERCGHKLETFGILFSRVKTGGSDGEADLVTLKQRVEHNNYYH